MSPSSTKTCRRDSSAAWSHILRLICLVADRFHDKQDSSLVAQASFPAYRALARYRGLTGRYRSRLGNGTTPSRTTRGWEKWAHSIQQRRHAYRAESQHQIPKRTRVASALDWLSHRDSEITSARYRVD